MENLLTIRNPESCHWYAPDGTPRHDAGLREARKEGLFGSVTGHMDIKRKPALEKWKTIQMVQQALTMPRLPDESDDAWFDRVQEADREERAAAPDMGTQVHSQLADYINGLEKHPRTEGVDLSPVLAWIDEHVTEARAEVCFADPLGYGGTIDLVGRIDGFPSTADWKTQKVKTKTLKSGTFPDPCFYDEWAWQLAAYTRHQFGIWVPMYSVIIDTAAAGCYVKEWTPEDAERGWQGYLGCKAVWEADKRYWPAKQPKGEAA